MSNASDSEQPPEQTETIPIVDVESPLPHPLPPPLPEDEWDPIAEHSNRNASAFPFSLYGIIPVILGTFSLLLLMLCGFFGYQYFQSVQASERKMKNLNQWIESLQNKSENFLQIPKVIDQNKEALKQLQEQNEYLTEALDELNAKQGDRCGPLPHWVQHRDYCYHQSLETASWLNCSDLCVTLNATFLKTGRKKLKNIMKFLEGKQTWLGLSYKNADKGWKWEDGSSPAPDLGLPAPSPDFRGKCVHTIAHTIGTDNCTRPSSCMCERAAHGISQKKNAETTTRFESQ